MKKLILPTIILFVLFSCSNKVSKSDLKHLNGYWEIKEVVFSDGNKKEYKINSIIDYIEINDLKGFKKKVVPQFDGSFKTSNDAEPFTIKQEDDGFKILYKNDLSEWEESIIFLSDDSYSTQNAEGTVYHFKRFEPIKIE
ncbi:hypothetical protein [Maribacter thermophilus]|uniref:hypothetical protein n=1 Tax=Maribacter thermophilus TaxID=1197874 RepID=UPI000640D641|nr:hypothetical protein [Maribacter thermophilus]